VLLDVATFTIDGPTLEAWLGLYRKRPRLTVTLTILTFVLMIGGIAIAVSVADRKAAAERERLRRESLSYGKQLEALNQLDRTTRELIQFVEAQRRDLAETEESIRSLRKEREGLLPIVEADRRTVEALFATQDRRARAGVWRERWVGFWIGVLSSIVASLVLGVALRVRRIRQLPASD
jgi:hypothetical protein